MKQIITIGSGSYGCRVSHKLYQKYLSQHNISLEAKINQKVQKQILKSKFNHIQTVFSENQKGKYTPRCIMTDFEDDVISQIKKQTKYLFSSSQFVYQKDGSAGNYVRGHYTIGKNLIGSQYCTRQNKSILDTLRKQAQKCDNFQSFIINMSFQGGSCGISTLIAQRISIQYPKKNVSIFGLFPQSKSRNGPVSLYNVLLGLSDISNFHDMLIIYDNTQIGKICEHQLGIQYPTYNEINQLIANSISWATWGQRFGGVNNSNLIDLKTNIIPYQQLRYLIPIMSNYETQHSQHLNKQTLRIQNSLQKIKRTFISSNSMFTTNFNMGIYLGISLQFRGIISSFQINNSIKTIINQKQLKFIYGENKFKIGYNLPQQVNKYVSLKQSSSVTVFNLSNHTSFKKYLQQLVFDYDQIYAKRGFVHWYVGEGISQGFFSQARQNIQSLIQNFKETQQLQYIQQDDESENQSQLSECS